MRTFYRTAQRIWLAQLRSPRASRTINLANESGQKHRSRDGASCATDRRASASAHNCSCSSGPGTANHCSACSRPTRSVSSPEQRFNVSTKSEVGGVTGGARRFTADLARLAQTGYRRAQSKQYPGLPRTAEVRPAVGNSYRVGTAHSPKPFGTNYARGSQHTPSIPTFWTNTPRSIPSSSMRPYEMPRMYSMVCSTTNRNNGLGRLPPSRQIVDRLGSWINPGRGAVGRLNQPDVPMLVASHVSGVANVVAAQRQIVLANNSVAHSSADVAPVGHLHTKCVAHWPGGLAILPSKPIPTFELSLDTLQRMKPALQRLEPVLAEGDQKRIADMLAPTPELATLLNLEETVKLLVNSRDFAETKKIIEDHPELSHWFNLFDSHYKFMRNVLLKVFINPMPNKTDHLAVFQ
jgi:hypothetical protein